MLSSVLRSDRAVKVKHRHHARVCSASRARSH
jgi:hypothetical protein